MTSLKRKGMENKPTSMLVKGPQNVKYDFISFKAYAQFCLAENQRNK